MRIAILLFLFLLLLPRAYAQECSVAEAKAADSATDALHSLPSIFKAYKHYGKCDDGAIAEGFSDAVVHLLATNWVSLHEAQLLFAKDPAFQEFAVRHVDSTADGNELGRIHYLAVHQCPLSAKALCEQLAKAASPQ
jgi:hypothetical protein